MLASSLQPLASSLLSGFASSLQPLASSLLSGFASSLPPLASSLLLGFCLTFVITAIIYHLLVLAAAAHFRRERKPGASFTPPVSVLKPVRGAEPDLYPCLATFCRQDYPEYEVLCCVEDREDPAGPAVLQLQKDFPNVPIRLLVADRSYGTNQKVNSLDKMYREMRHEYLVISDDDISVGPDYLRHIMAECGDPQVGVVTCPYRGRPGGTLASRFEAVGIAGEFFSGVLVARLLEGIRFAMGSTMVTRKELVAAMGGFPVLADYQNDDFELGSRLARLGYRGVLSHYVVDTLLPADTWRSMLRHQFRWMRGQACSRPKGHLGLIFTYGSVFLLGALALRPGSPAVWWVGGVWLALRLLSAWMAGVVNLKDPTLRRHWFLVPPRELLTVGLWAASLFYKKIIWKGQQYIIVRGKMIRI